jgi:hypothetical protein
VALGRAQLEIALSSRFGLRHRNSAAAAAESFRAALAVDPEEANARNDLARAELLTGRTAAAVSGFGAAAALDPAGVASFNVSVAVRVAVAQGAYVVFVVTYLGLLLISATDGRPGTGDPADVDPSGSLLSRAAGLLVAAALGVALTWRLLGPWRSLEPGLRPVVLRRVRRDPWLAAGTGALLLCPLLLLGFTVVPRGTQDSLVSAALVVALAARLLVWISGRRARRADERGR